MKKILYGFVAIMLVFTASGFSVEKAFAVTERISCPYTSGGNTTVVNFGEEAVLISNLPNGHETAKYPVSLTAGDYDVTLVAWDNHSDKGGQNQTLERYFVKLFKGSSNFQNVGTTVDIPDSQDSVSTIATESQTFPNAVQTGLGHITIADSVTSISARHAHVGAGNHQSLSPICVKFTKRTTTPNPDLSVTCSISDTSIRVGETTTFTANATGGNGTYSYLWTGAANGTSRVETETFNTVGSFNSWVRVTSGGETATADCAAVVVEEDPRVALEGYCSVSDQSVRTGENVTFTAHAEGNAPYTYTWLNVVDGTGINKTRNFSAEGSYTARVRIDDSRGETLTVSCPVVVVDNDDTNPDLTGSCSVSDTRVRIGESVTFTANANGTAPYTYTWLDVVSGSDRTESRSFSSEGSYTARVRINDHANKSLTVTCPVLVVDEDDSNNNFSVSCRVSDTRIDEGDTVRFSVDVNGGDSPYTYDWRGDIDGDESVESVRFNREGEYDVTVRVEDEDGRVATDSCDTIVVDEESNNNNNNDDLEVQCKVSDTRVEVGDTVTYTADVDGGESPYEYRWSGDVSGDDRRESVRFNRPGRYTADVRVEDDENDRDTDSCPTVVVEDRGSNVLGASTIFTPQNPTGQVASVNTVFLGQIPVTGAEDVTTMLLYLFGLIVWSVIVVYFIIRNKNRKNISNKIEDFKLSNMKQKGLI